MKKASARFLLFVAVSLFLLVGCGPVIPAATETAVAAETRTAGVMPATATPACSPENWPCPSDSLTLTAVIGATFDAIPSNTPPAGVTLVPIPGDLGWGAVHGRITDGVTNVPIEGATVTCEHFSYTSPYLCNAVTTTNAEGIYSFVPVFFHDTDRITLIVEAPGYLPLRFEESFFTLPDLHADLGLFPSAGDTPAATTTPLPPPTSTPPVVCTARPCPGGGATCNGVCPSLTPTPILMCTPPPCPWRTFACGNPNGCPGGCGTICLTPTPTP